MYGFKPENIGILVGFSHLFPPYYNYITKKLRRVANPIFLQKNFLNI